MRKMMSVLMEESEQALCHVFTAHCSAMKLGTITDLYVANRILNRYARRDSGLIAARKLFDEMPERDNCSWNTMIAGHVSDDNLESAWELRNSMNRSGFQADQFTFGSILKGVAGANRVGLGKQVHSSMIKVRMDENVYSGSALLSMYAKSGLVNDALIVFDKLPHLNTVAWNGLISGFVQQGDRAGAFNLLQRMEKVGALPDNGTFCPLLTLLHDDELHSSTLQLYCQIIKYGAEEDQTVCNAAITSFSCCGSLRDAETVFHRRGSGAVAWNSMLAAYIMHEKEEEAFSCFLNMQHSSIEPDAYTYSTIIGACFSEAMAEQGKSLHGLMIKRGLELSLLITNTLIAMYLKSNTNSIAEAVKLFESIECKDSVSWNSILTGLAQIGFGEHTLKVFEEMRMAMVEIDYYSLSAVLRSCSDLAMLQLGQQVHSLTIRSGFHESCFVAGSLIFMYSKCGVIGDARRSFQEARKHTSVIWNSIIFACAQHGQAAHALELFLKMKEMEVRPDHITFVALLTACSHAGMVEQGQEFLRSMESEYQIPPRMEHYACAIDLFGRSGWLNEARLLIESMPFKPDVMLWKTLLGACMACGNIELAAQVGSHLLELDPGEHCTYIILSNMYGHLQKWEQKAMVKKKMRDRKVKKVPGWSWIEINNEIHSFIAEGQIHLRSKQIYQRLDELMEEIKWISSGDLTLNQFNLIFDS